MKIRVKIIQFQQEKSIQIDVIREDISLFWGGMCWISTWEYSRMHVREIHLLARVNLLRDDDEQSEVSVEHVREIHLLARVNVFFVINRRKS